MWAYGAVVNGGGRRGISTPVASDAELPKASTIQYQKITKSGRRFTAVSSENQPIVPALLQAISFR